MASTYSDLLRLEKQADGENDTTWGQKANAVFEMLEDAVAGRAAITHSDAASYTLTTANGSEDEARKMAIVIGGALGAARNTVVPTSAKLYFAKNATTGGFATTVKTSAGSGIVVPNGMSTTLLCDGTNVVNAIDYLDTLRVQDSTFTIVDTDNHTRIAKFDAGSITAGQTRTYTLPDASTTVVGTGTTQTLTNKTLTTPVIAQIKPSAGNTLTLPDATDTVVTLAATQTLTSKTLTAPTINGGTHTAITSLGIRSTGSGAFDLTLANTENLTAGRTLTITLNNAARTISLAGDLTTAAAFITAGANSLTLTTTGATNVTLPTTGTLATIAGTETLTNKRITLRIQTAADATSITATSDSADQVNQTNTQGAGTLTINAPTGTPTDGQPLIIRVKSTNAHTLSFNAIFRASNDFALPTALTGSSETDYFGFKYNTADTKWDFVAYTPGFG